MSEFDFKARFVAALPSLPPVLYLQLDEFIFWEAGQLPVMPEEDAEFLVKQGLPDGAAPFLSFAVYSDTEATRRRMIFGVADHYFPLGHTGSGDVLALDCQTREVVYFNHDFNNQRVFINATLPLFAQCLCVFQQHLRDNTMARCLDEIGRIDPLAAAPGSLWAEEVSAELG
ncbi:SUKH-4 family immunity protein [Pseudomonas sp. O64]|uniref:SUKH-4 family immunity protein n=1 Tax=unclassified Pseudomonas TaxID=196821 RepID=UPI0021D94AF0|nr:SUKH-4 family immunity protein [Pseudomonas sp. YeP6b]UXZ20171.1 SUKH-4 family immunity protein [Pseudomonas sp. YeP6b]